MLGLLEMSDIRNFTTSLTLPGKCWSWFAVHNRLYREFYALSHGKLIFMTFNKIEVCFDKLRTILTITGNVHMHPKRRRKRGKAFALRAGNASHRVA